MKTISGIWRVCILITTPIFRDLFPLLLFLSSPPFFHALCARLILSLSVMSRYTESPLPYRSLSVFTRFAVRSFFLSLLCPKSDLPLSLSLYRLVLLIVSLISVRYLRTTCNLATS